MKIERFIFIMILSLLLVIIPTINSFAQSDYLFRQRQFSSSIVWENENYSNEFDSVSNNNFASIIQIGSYNKGEIWQKNLSSQEKSNSASIVQVGNSNTALIRQFTVNARAEIRQYGNDNLATIEQSQFNSHVRINQFTNDSKIRFAN